MVTTSSFMSAMPTFASMLRSSVILIGASLGGVPASPSRVARCRRARESPGSVPAARVGANHRAASGGGWPGRQDHAHQMGKAEDTEVPASQIGRADHDDLTGGRLVERGAGGVVMQQQDVVARDQ